METLEGQITQDIYSRGLHTSAWLDLPKQEPWPEGQGTTLQVLTLGRSLPSNPLVWQDVVVSAGGEGGACIPPTQRLAITNSLKEFNLQETSLESPDICVTDLMVAFKAEEQLNHLMEVLAENTNQAWINRNRSEYVRLAGHKMIATLGGLLDDDEWAATMPTSVLTGGFLKQAYIKLIRSGAGKKSYGNMNGKPTFVALIGMETSERIAMEETYRSLLKYSDRVPELLAPLGVDKNYRGFWLLDEVFPPRHNLVEGEWVEVPAYTWEGVGAAAELIENPAYETAETEDTVIFHEDVYRSIVMPPAKPMGQAKFESQSYRGDWSFKNIIHRTENPDGKYGFFRGLFGNGSKPKFTQYGFVIRHLRCGIAAEAMACDES
jgi:hypothetical protein